MKLSEWLKEYRNSHGISMQTMADMCGFSKAYIGMLEKGVNPTTKRPISPTMQTFQKISDGVGMDINDFIKMLDNDQPITLKVSTSPITNSTATSLSQHDLDLLAAYKAAPDNAKQVVDLTLEPYMPASKQDEDVYA